MASPYFSNIQVNKVDYSGMERTAENIAKMQMQTGKMLGTAIGVIGSSYFEKKEAEALADDFMKTDEFRDLALSKNMSPFDIQQIRQDEKFRAKEGQKFLKDAGGVDEALKKYREGLKFKQEFEVNELNKIRLTESNRTIGLQNEQLQKQSELKDSSNAYMRWRSDPKNRDLVSDPSKVTTKYLESVKEQGGNVNIALQGAEEINKAMGLGRYNPSLLPALKQGMMKTERDKTKLTELNFLSTSEKEKALDAIIMDMNLPQAQIDALSKQLDSLVVPDGGVRKTAKGIAELVGFGEFEQTMDAMGDLRQTSTLIDASLTMLQQNDGKWMPKVVNPVSASVSLIKLAKLAQGAGVLSNQDVDRIKGDKGYSASIDRWFDKRIGSDYELTAKDVSSGGQFFKDGNPMINPTTGEEYEAGETIKFGGGDVSAEDLMFMKDVMKTMQSKFTSNAENYVPRIFAGVKAKYGGLTLDEIDGQLGGIGEFMKGGIDSLHENQAMPLKKDIDQAYKAIVDKNQSKEDFISMNTQDPTPEEIRRLSSAYNQASETALDNNAITLGNYENNKQERTSTEIIDESGTRPEQNKLNQTPLEEYNDNIKKILKSVDSNVEEKRSGNQVKAGIAGASTYGVVKGASKVAGMLKETPDAYEFKDEVPDGNRKLKKQVNDALSGGNKDEKLLKDVINNQLDEKVVKKKGVASATKALGKSIVKKVGSIAIGGLVSGGVGWVIGSLDMINDISKLRDEEYDNQIDLLKSKQSTLDGKELELNKALVSKLNYKKNNPVKTALKKDYGYFGKR